jgi:hypothetical protein
MKLKTLRAEVAKLAKDTKLNFTVVREEATVGDIAKHSGAPYWRRRPHERLGMAVALNGERVSPWEHPEGGRGVGSTWGWWKGFKKAWSFLEYTDDGVYCDEHCSVHDNTADPYNYGEPSCSRVSHFGLFRMVDPYSIQECDVGDLCNAGTDCKEEWDHIHLREECGSDV